MPVQKPMTTGWLFPGTVLSPLLFLLTYSLKSLFTFQILFLYS